MKLKHFYFSLSICCLSFVLLTAFMIKPAKSTSASLEVSKKIKFSHKIHKDAVECASCHSGIAESGSLNEKLFPKKEDCSSCHDVTDTKNCNFCHYDNVQVPLQGENTALLFSHKSHLAQKQECKNCHAGIEDSEYLAAGQHFKPKMDNCYTCHKETGKAKSACETCHISLVNLKPQSHLVNNFMRFHKYQAVSPNANCVMCHTSSSCEDCHSATNVITEPNTKTSFPAPYSPSQSTAGTAQQKITRVHDLGFRYTHGIDARGKETECASCHQTATFCVQCHGSRQQDYAMAGVKPSSHLKLTFKGVGADGGDHAKMGRRDIESCASCHDMNGSDPVCARCHVKK